MQEFKLMIVSAALVALTGCFAPGVKVAARFGHDPVDATANVQAALDSGERHLILDGQAGDWIVRPLHVKNRDGLVIDFEDGAHLVAKRGDFRHRNDTLLTFVHCTNITLRGVAPERCGLRMWHDDYLNFDKQKTNGFGYVWSEWRHGLSLLSCAHVTLEGLSSNASGGDGLYVSTANGPDSASCADVVVRRCIFDHNNRQGISVIGSRGFVVEDTLLSNTYGTAPAAGIDFEPNKPHEAITDVVMRRCRAINNQGAGFEFYLGQLDHTSAPLNALFEDCVAVSNRDNFLFSGGAQHSEPYDYGTIEVRNCRFASARGAGIRLADRPKGTGRFVLRDTTLEDNCTLNTNQVDLVLAVSGHGAREPNTVVFDNTTVIRTRPGRAFNDTSRTRPYSGRATVLEGTLRTVVEGQAETHVFDAAWNAAHHPYRLTKGMSIARVPAPLTAVTVVDRAPGKMVELAYPLFFRDRRRRIVFYADKAKQVHLRLQQTLVGKRDYKAPAKAMQVYSIGAKQPINGKGVRVPADPQGGVVALAVPKKGFYELELPTGGNGVAILGTDVPLAYDVRTAYVNFVAPCRGPAGRYRKGWGELSFVVPEGKTFVVLHAGEGTERLGLDIVDPSGKIVRHEPELDDGNELDVTAKAGGLWTLRTRSPTSGAYEDFNLSLAGIPGWLFVTPEKYWR